MAKLSLRRVSWVIGLAILVANGLALAKPCGDDVDGADVPCACGDMVVSDVSLGDDPVSNRLCSGDGLIVRAVGSKPLTVDLAGRTLRGDGSGNGIWVLYGGDGGARIVSGGAPAILEGFATGVVAGGDDAVARVENIRVVRPRRDGVRLRGSGFRLVASEVENAGRDGFSLSGRGFRVENTRSVGNRRYGYMIMGQGAELGAAGSNIVAAHNGSAGFSVMGAGHALRDCVAEANGKEGVALSGGGMRVEGCVARANSGDGISGMGSNWYVGANQALANGGNGVAVGGRDVVDGGGNSGADNGFREWGTVVQCAVSGVACLP